MSSPLTNSQNRPREDGGGGGHNPHAILRVSSAHGPRDSVVHYIQNPQQAQQTMISQQNQQKSMNQNQNPPYSNNPLQISSSHQQSRNPPVVNEIPAPPMYQQAISSIGNEFGKVSSTRKSPESRAVQAVPPFGVREVIATAASIPDECQVKKFYY